MSERLRPDDMAFLVTESASTPDAQRHARDLRAAVGGFDYDRLVALIARPDRVRAALPPAAALGPGPAGQPGLGRRRGLRPRPTTYAAPRCRGRARSTQLRDLTARIMSRRLDRHRPLWEMYFIEGVEGGRFAILSKSHQILVDGVATIDLGQVILDVDPELAETVHVDWHPHHVPSAVDAGRRRRARLGARPAAGHGDPVRQRRQRGPHRRRRRRPGRPRSRARCPTAAPRRSRRSTPTLSEQRRFVDREDVARGLPRGPAVPRRHRQRRHPRHRHRRDAQLADDPGRVGARQPVAAGAGADERDRQRARADLAGQPGRRPPARPADRRVQPGGPAAPGVLRAQGAQGDRPGGRRRPARRRRRLRADDLPRARRRGSRPPSRGAASTWWSRTCPARSSRCTPPARR